MAAIVASSDSWLDLTTLLSIPENAPVEIQNLGGGGESLLYVTDTYSSDPGDPSSLPDARMISYLKDITSSDRTAGDKIQVRAATTGSNVIIKVRVGVSF